MIAARRVALVIASLGVLAGAGAPSVARADDARNLAEQLFSEGKKLMGEGKYEEACPKLAESQRLDPAGGTILNLAVCHENQGRFASAWSEFREAVGLARTDGRRDREQLAAEHLAMVEPKVSHLTLTVEPRTEVPGFTLKLDGHALGQAAWNSSLPVDPGTHDIATTAPGKLERRVTVQVGIAETKSVALRPLEDAPSSSSSATVTLSTPEVTGGEADTGKRVAGIVVGGLGVAALGVGTAFGIEALQKRRDSNALCSGDTCPTQAGIDLNSDARRFANYADIGLGVGIVGVVLGTYLVLTSGGAKPVAASTALRVKSLPGTGVGGSGLELSGTW